jgi:hypothetical protein
MPMLPDYLISSNPAFAFPPPTLWTRECLLSQNPAAGFKTSGCITFHHQQGVNVRVTAARSRQDSWASSAKKIRPLEKKLGRSKKFLLQIFGPIFANCC